MTFVIEAQVPKAKLTFYILNQVDNSFESPILGYKKYFAKAAFYDIQVYNPSVGLLESYSFISDSQYDKKDQTSLIYRSQYLFNFNSNAILTPFLGRHIDSFNPYGVSNIGEAFALGVINTILKKN